MEIATKVTLFTTVVTEEEYTSTPTGMSMKGTSALTNGTERAHSCSKTVACIVATLVTEIFMATAGTNLKMVTMREHGSTAIMRALALSPTKMAVIIRAGSRVGLPMELERNAKQTEQDEEAPGGMVNMTVTS